jgi:hypothetical protein
MRVQVVLLGLAILLTALAVGTTSAHYAPQGGDQFAYDESVTLGNGTGNYSGYTESTAINGSVSVTGIAPNGTALAQYYNVENWQNNQGQSNTSTYSGKFSFSPATFLYVNGTDGQSGYTNPYVWFFMDNSLTVGSKFYVLNTQMSVVNTSYSYDLGTAAGTYVKTIFAEGNGSYQRNDIYGVFTADYNWKMYFDPATGYVVGYLYVEQDTDGPTAGFTWTDALGVTHTSYALTPDSAPPTPPPNNPGGSMGTDTSTLLWISLAVVAIVVVGALVYALTRRRRPNLPRHSATGQVSYAPPPTGPPPPGIHLIPSGQPAVQQIVVKETVKVNCRYCGALIDTTVEKCPFCGAART